MAISTRTSLAPGMSDSSVFNNMPLGEWSNETKRVLAILDSRTIKENVVKRLNLISVFVKKSNLDKDARLQMAVAVLNQIKKINTNLKSGLIVVSIDYENPEMAKEIANTYIIELQEILNSKSFSVSRMKKEFIEKQLLEVENKLKKQQNKMANFRKKTKLINPLDQSKETIGFFTNLIQKKTELEVQLKSMESALSPDSPLLKSLKSQIRSINAKMRNLEGSSGGGALPTLNTVPGKIVEFEAIGQELLITKTIYETMLKLYEQVKIEEAQENLFIQVIDPAIKPISKVRPIRTVMVGIASISALIISSMLVFFIEWIKHIRATYQRERDLV